MTEVKAIRNSRPLTVETVSDSNSLFPILPSNILTMKTSVVIPPPSTFQRADLYCRKTWKCVQDITTEFWSRWRIEFLTSLQIRMKWNETRRNFKKMNTLEINGQWHMSPKQNQIKMEWYKAYCGSWVTLNQVKH